MNNEKMNQIIGEAYKEYVSTHENFEWTDDFCKKNLKDCGDQWDVFSQEEFINKCKTNPEFSERWGLRIEERELSFKERRDLAYHYAIKNNKFPLCIDAYGVNGIPKYMETINNTGWDIPTRLITITYNNETIESYE